MNVDINIPKMQTARTKVSLDLMEVLIRRLRTRVELLDTTLKQLRQKELLDAKVVQKGIPILRDFCKDEPFRLAFARLMDYLEDALSAHHRVLYLYTEASVLPSIPLLQVNQPTHPTRRAFLALIEHALPLCDSLQDEHLLLLLGNSQTEMRSTLLLPVQGKTWDALLFIASQEADHYHQGIRLDFLVSVSVALVSAIDRQLLPGPSCDD